MQIQNTKDLKNCTTYWELNILHVEIMVISSVFAQTNPQYQKTELKAIWLTENTPNISHNKIALQNNLETMHKEKVMHMQGNIPGA